MAWGQIVQRIVCTVFQYFFSSWYRVSIQLLMGIRLIENKAIDSLWEKRSLVRTDNFLKIESEQPFHRKSVVCTRVFRKEPVRNFFLIILRIGENKNSFRFANQADRFVYNPLRFAGACTGEYKSVSQNRRLQRGRQDS